MKNYSPDTATQGTLFTISVTLILTLTLTACVPMQPISRSDGTANPDYALQIERGRNIVAPVTRRGSAVSVAVGVDGELVWSEGFGYRSLEQKQAVSVEDSFRLYSLMKQVTAIVALQSVLRGEIGFETTARDVLPDLPAAYDAVTLQQLLTHRAGVRHYHDPQEAVFFGHCERAEIALDRFVHDPLLFTPGERESYSTYGFVLASAMLERRSGMSFPDLVRERLNMATGASFALESNSPDSALKFYDVDNDGKMKLAPPVDNSCKMGGGGFRGTAQDLVRFHNAVLNGELVPMAAVQQLLAGRDALAAGGSGTGGEAVSVVELNSRVSVVLLSNTSGLEQQIALNRVRDLLLSVFSDSQASGLATSRTAR